MFPITGFQLVKTFYQSISHGYAFLSQTLECLHSSQVCHQRLFGCITDLLLSRPSKFIIIPNGGLQRWLLPLPFSRTATEVSAAIQTALEPRGLRRALWNMSQLFGYFTRILLDIRCSVPSFPLGAAILLLDIRSIPTATSKCQFQSCCFFLACRGYAALFSSSLLELKCNNYITL